MSKRILIVEDEMEIAKVLSIELEYEGYEVLIEHDGRSGLETALTVDVDLILLDVMLPVFSGIEVLRRFRNAGKYTPVILLTARNATMDKVVGLDQGANDYVTKPFEIEELLARVRSCMRSNASTKSAANTNKEAPLLCVKDLVVNTETRDVSRSDEEVILTPKEYDLLVYLLTHKNKTVTREGILTNVWGYEFEGETNVIDVYIRHLRKKLENEFSSPLIQTVRGVGYTVREK
jgi:DNA-binding response OmpR family regulator